jgi:hypothetical protein
MTLFCVETYCGAEIGWLPECSRATLDAGLTSLWAFRRVCGDRRMYRLSEFSAVRFGADLCPVSRLAVVAK